jgi:hypothetical protein
VKQSMVGCSLAPGCVSISMRLYAEYITCVQTMRDGYYVRRPSEDRTALNRGKAVISTLQTKAVGQSSVCVCVSRT